MSDTEQTTAPTVRHFADWIREHDRGRAHDQMSELLHDLVQAVKDTGKGGTVTLAVKVVPLGKTDTDQLKVTAVVAVKKPTPEPRAVIFFTDAAGNLTTKDPAQMEFESLRVVDRPTPKEIAR